jgi:hypothetical protein
LNNVDGFQILSALRNLFPPAQNAMMDRATFDEHRGFVIDGNGRSVNVKSNLTGEEAATFQMRSTSGEILFSAADDAASVDKPVAFSEHGAERRAFHVESRIVVLEHQPRLTEPAAIPCVSAYRVQCGRSRGFRVMRDRDSFDAR